MNIQQLRDNNLMLSVQNYLLTSISSYQNHWTMFAFALFFRKLLTKFYACFCFCGFSSVAERPKQKAWWDHPPLLSPGNCVCRCFLRVVVKNEKWCNSFVFYLSQADDKFLLCAYLFPKATTWPVHHNNNPHFISGRGLCTDKVENLAERCR